MSTENTLPKLLIVEDDPGLLKQYGWAFPNYDKKLASDLESAIAAFNDCKPDIILLDLGLPPDPDNASVGLEFLELVTTSEHDTKVIVITGSEQEEHALEAVKKGAVDYLSKDTSQELIEYSIQKTFTLLSLERENKKLKKESLSEECIIGESEKIKTTIEMMNRVAPLNIRILLSGESGTGKELFAQGIHKASNREGEFIAINCASIPESLLESELFGHEKGSFTGAVKQKIGKVEQANGGTLFLDEIGDMPAELQTKLLRFLQEREIERVGGNKKIPVDVRVVCATHRNLEEMKKGDFFREDLYYRLAEYTLNIPPLKERGSDVVLLAEYYLERFKKELNFNGKCPTGFTNEAKSAMLQHGWDGNVRELQNKVKSALVICFDRELVSHHDLQLSTDNIHHPLSKDSSPTHSIPEKYHGKKLSEAKLDIEFEMIRYAMEKFSNNVTKASSSLGISRQTLYTISKRCGYEIPA